MNQRLDSGIEEMECNIKISSTKFPFIAFPYEEVFSYTEPQWSFLDVRRLNTVINLKIATENFFSYSGKEFVCPSAVCRIWTLGRRLSLPFCGLIDLVIACCNWKQSRC